MGARTSSDWTIGYSSRPPRKKKPLHSSNSVLGFMGVLLRDGRGAGPARADVEAETGQLRGGDLHQEAEQEDAEEELDEEEAGLIILKVIEENGEELLSTLDSEEELNEIYQLFSDQLFADDDDEE